MPDLTACVVVAIAMMLFVVLVAGPEFFRPLGCPHCGAPELEGHGWLKCPECGRLYWRNGNAPK